MIISKAIEILTLSLPAHCHKTDLDLINSIQLGIEAMKRLEDIRKHPAHPVYGPLPGESPPDLGIR